MAHIETPPATRLHNLTGRVALITGTGCLGEGWGNGMATAFLFAKQGAIIFGCDISLEAGETTRDRILSEMPESQVTIVKGDVASSASMREVVDSCVELYGRIDILVNNVGVGGTGDAAEIDEETWDKHMNVNLKSVYITCHLVLPIMERQVTGGVIVNLSSLAALRYLSNGIAYTTAKGAILCFSRSTALTYAKRGVRVNTVIPGMMNTPLLKAVGPNYEDFCRRRDAQCPMGRMGTAWDTANAVLFLASDEVSYITGTELLVDGGYLHGGPAAKLISDFSEQGDGS